MKDIQNVVHEKCDYSFGPFPFEPFTSDDAVKEAVAVAKENGFNGDELINVKITQTGYTGIVVSKYCLKVEGNLVISK